MAHQIGFIGLGKMGKLMVAHLRAQGIYVVAYNRTPTPEATVSSLKDLVQKLVKPRVIFLMVAASGVDDVISQLALESGDMLIDGGNTQYKDTVHRAETFAAKNIHYIDCGTSGGLEGAKNGACLMLGGEEEVVKNLSWLWDAIAAKDGPASTRDESTRGGWKYFGPSGAGHFVKMVHNGIEYGMDQALGEGIEILAKGPYHIDLPAVVTTWQKGSIIRGYLVELLGQALEADPTLAGFTGKVGGGETGGWTLAAAREFGVAAPILENSLAARQKSLAQPTTSSKVVSALRRGYGGHDEAK
jgi:6-phosphogluconate dehydrogenase